MKNSYTVYYADQFATGHFIVNQLPHYGEACSLASAFSRSTENRQATIVMVIGSIEPNICFFFNGEKYEKVS